MFFFFTCRLNSVKARLTVNFWLSYSRVLSHPHRFNTEIWQQRPGSRFCSHGCKCGSWQQSFIWLSQGLKMIWELDQLLRESMWPGVSFKNGWCPHKSHNLVEQRKIRWKSLQTWQGDFGGWRILEFLSAISVVLRSQVHFPQRHSHSALAITLTNYTWIYMAWDLTQLLRWRVHHSCLTERWTWGRE